MPLLVCAGLFCVWGMARNNMRNNIKAKSTLFRQADFVPHWASKFGGSCAKFTKCMVDFLHFTQANSVMLMSKAQIFEKAVQNISLNRLIHGKAWGSSKNSLEKVWISAKTRWKNVQGHKTGRSCNSYTILRVFFATLKKMGTPALCRHTDMRWPNDAAQPAPFSFWAQFPLARLCEWRTLIIVR